MKKTKKNKNAPVQEELKSGDTSLSDFVTHLKADDQSNTEVLDFLSWAGGPDTYEFVWDITKAM